MVVNGIHFPDAEKHLTDFQEVKEKGTYQKDKLDAALSYCKKFRTAVDVGAHIGLWSRHLTQSFRLVEAFEPVPVFRDFYKMNVEGNYNLHPYACGAKTDFINLNLYPENTGHTHVSDKGQICSMMVPLDCMNLQNVDFIKIDTEGYELFVCEGARRTILENKPVICVEQKHTEYTKDIKAAVKLLEGWGYEIKQTIHRDYILTYNE